jgi:hypothetical protein
MDAEDTSTAYDFLMGRIAQKSRANTAKSEEHRKAREQLDNILEIAQQYHEQESNMDVREEDLRFLADDGLDVRALLDVAQSTQSGSESSLPQITLQKNAIYLFELYKMQEKRFASRDQTIGAREKEIGMFLKSKNPSSGLNWISTSDRYKFERPFFVLSFSSCGTASFIDGARRSG